MQVLPLFLFLIAASHVVSANDFALNKCAVRYILGICDYSGELCADTRNFNSSTGRVRCQRRQRRPYPSQLLLWSVATITKNMSHIFF
jgi:hypothetical protein